MTSAMTRGVREDDENVLYWRRNKRDDFFNRAVLWVCTVLKRVGNHAAATQAAGASHLAMTLTADLVDQLNGCA